MEIARNDIPTYEEFQEINKTIKQNLTLENKDYITIIDVDLEKNLVKCKSVMFNGKTYDINEGWLIIDTLINSVLLYSNFYITNVSALRLWKGFSTNNLVYLTEKIIEEVDGLIYDEHIDYRRFFVGYKISFQQVERDAIDSLLLRNKIAYKAVNGQLSDHFWFIKKDVDIIVISDKPIYTPIYSSGLFSHTHFGFIDLSNVNLSHTKSFDNAFFSCYCKSINFGTNPITKRCVSLDSMFNKTHHLQEIDLRSWDLSHVQTITNFCFLSNVKSLYLNPNIKKSLKDYVGALEGTELENTNIDKIFSKKQLNIMFKTPSALDFIAR